MRGILLFGPQGSGKGTQGEKLSAWLQLPLVVTGNIFRSNIKSGTALGQLAQGYIQRGELVPDEVTNQMIQQRLAEPDCVNGFVLDGFPRSVAQAEALHNFTTVTHLLHISISDAEAVRRIAERRTCVANGHVYHVLYNPPKQAGVCDSDGSPLQQREDDTETALRRRLDIYHRATEPLLNYYRQRQLVFDINGEQLIAKVWTDIQAIFQTV
ncbi:MAG: nucleoside monophosphate kinase [Candidatus Kerfeldbacteria bacterium]|nr:nucleoside monophosphate kinase [Candidatus Kerfeldbacteria bacterium]